MTMAEQYEIVDVGQDSARDLWYVQYEMPEGLQTHWFHKSTLEWRAAEYGLDDVAEILDIILHEPLMDPEEERGATVESLLHPKPKAARAADNLPATLYTATSTAEAREAHRDRIKATKTKTRIVATKGDSLAVIRDRHGITVDGLRAKREYVDARRWIKQYGSLPAAPAVPKETV